MALLIGAAVALLIGAIAALIFMNFVRGDSVNYFLAKDLVLNSMLFVGLTAVLISRNEPMAKFIFQSYLPEIWTSASQVLGSIRHPELRLPDIRSPKVAATPAASLYDSNPMTSQGHIP